MIQVNSERVSNLYLYLYLQYTVCAEIVTELIPDRAGPVIFENFLLELKAFRLIPVNSSNLSCKKSKA